MHCLLVATLLLTGVATADVWPLFNTLAVIQ